MGVEGTDIVEEGKAYNKVPNNTGSKTMEIGGIIIDRLIEEVEKLRIPKDWINEDLRQRLEVTDKKIESLTKEREKWRTTALELSKLNGMLGAKIEELLIDKKQLIAKVVDLTPDE